MKIVFISYPKSGRTWMRYIFSLLNCEVRFTHAGHGTSFSKKRPELFSGPKTSVLGEKNIFMHRNPLDTAVSMFFQVHKHDSISLSVKSLPQYLWLALLKRLPPKDINKFVIHPIWGVENICRFNRAWLDVFSNRTEDLVVSYEEAKKDTAGVVEKFIKLAGIPPVDVAEIIRKSDFDSMKKMELQQGKSKELRLYGLRPGDPDTMKVRKGVVKGYREYLSPETISEAGRIAARFGFEV